MATLTATLNHRRSEFVPERVSSLYRSSTRDIPVVLGAALIAMYALWGLVNPAVLALWLGWFFVTCSVRVLLAVDYRRQKSLKRTARQWENYFCLASALLGLIGGLQLAFIHPDNFDLQVLLVLVVIASIAMGLPHSLAPSPRAFVSFLLPIITPLVVLSFLKPDLPHVSMGLVVLLFGALLLTFYLSSTETFPRVLRSDDQRATLFESLSAGQNAVYSASVEQALVFDTSLVGFATIRSGRIDKCNLAFAHILGYPLQELVGMPMPGLLSMSALEQAKQDSGPDLINWARLAGDEIQVKTRNGTAIWVKVEVRALDTQSAQSDAVLALMDISGRKRTEEALKVTAMRLDTALRSPQLALWEWDERRGTVLFVDAAWSAMLGEEPREKYLPVADQLMIIHPDDLLAAQQARARCFKGLSSEFQVEYRVRVASGEWKWVRAQGRVLERDQAGKAKRMSGTYLDITNRKFAELATESALARELGLSEMRSKLGSAAAQELRAQLVTTLSDTEALEHHADRLTYDQWATELRRIKDGALNARARLDNMLAIGGIDAGVLSFRPSVVGFRKVVEGIVKDFQLGEGKNRLISVSDSSDLTHVELDENLFRLILNNLLSNAAKFSPETTEILVRLSREGDNAVTEVKDSGSGIPIVDQKRLFNAFHRGSNIENRPGTGLGLAMVKKAVEFHGGRITFNSQVQQGTIFRLSLPQSPQFLLNSDKTLSG